MSVETARRRFRQSERKLMNATGTLSRPGEPTYIGGVYSDGSTTVAADLPALIRPNSPVGYDVPAGGGEVRLRTVRLIFPYDTDAQIDDRYTVATSTGDVGLVGRTYRVTDVLFDEWKINRTTIAEEVV